MNISKEQFVQILEAVIAQQERDHKIARALDVVVEDGGNHLLVFSTPLTDTLVKALDKDDIISWWLWDGPEHGLKAEEFAITREGGERIAIHDAGELFDYMEKYS